MPKLHPSQVWQIPNTRQYTVPFLLKKKGGYGLINSARNVCLYLCIHVNDTSLHPRVLWGGHRGRVAWKPPGGLSRAGMCVCASACVGGEDPSWGGEGMYTYLRISG